MTEEARNQFEAEQQAYWAQRDELKERYSGRWVAIVGGHVVAVGDDSGAVIREAFQKTGSRIGYVGRVGHEEIVYRIRRVDCRDDVDENILGRDVLNEFRLTLCAKQDQVEFEWADSP